MRTRDSVPLVLGLVLVAVFPALAELQTGPTLPYLVVRDWAQLPAGWNFGEVSAVDVEKSDNVWVFIAHYVAVDSTGAIYVSEIKNWRVQKFVK